MFISAANTLPLHTYTRCSSYAGLRIAFPFPEHYPSIYEGTRRQL